MKIQKILLKIFVFFITIICIFVNRTNVYASYEDEFPCDDGDYDYKPSEPINPDGPPTWCALVGCDDGGGGGDPAPCYPHDCSLPSCPEGTTNFDTGYSLGTMVSCDKGCGETKYGNCYEIPPSCDPLVEDCEIPPICDPQKEKCDKEISTDSEVIFKIGENNTNSLGYTSTKYSGLEINNPVGVEAKYYGTKNVDGVETNNVEELEAIYFWMEKQNNSTLPKGIQWIYGNKVSSGKTETNDSYGFMVRKVNGSWSDIYIPLVTGGKTYWANIGQVGTDFSIYGPNGKSMVQVTNLSVTQTDKVVSNFNLKFLNENSGITNYEKVYEGMYSIYTMANDVFGFTPYDNYTDQKIIDKLPYEENQIRFYNYWKRSDQQWGIDLTPPRITKLQPVIKNSTEISLNWSSEDLQSSISYAVSNVFRLKDGLIKNSPLIYPSGSNNKIILNFQTSGDIIGKINGNNILWQVPNVSSRDELIDLVDNRGGYIDFYLTVYDQGGNNFLQSLRFKLGEWIETKGGFFFSGGGVYVDTRVLEEGVWIQNKWFDNYGLNEDEVDLGTELVAGNIGSSLGLRILNKISSNESYRAINYEGLRKTDIYYSYLERLEDIDESKFVKISTPTLSGNLTQYCSSGDDCTKKIVVNNVEGDITVVSGFKCDGKGIIFASGNIYIQPDITNSNNASACIFISKGNIYIQEGKDKSTNKIDFDIVEGYFLTNGTITIEKETKSIDDIQDGLFIEGGLVALGKDQEEQVSILLERELHLADRHPYPVLNVINHPKYGKLIKELFGGDKLLFKTEIGFKEY